MSSINETGLVSSGIRLPFVKARPWRKFFSIIGPKTKAVIIGTSGKISFSEQISNYSKK